MGATPSLQATVLEYERLKSEGGHSEEEIIAKLKLKFHEYGVDGSEYPLGADGLPALGATPEDDAESKATGKRGGPQRSGSRQGLRKSNSLQRQDSRGGGLPRSDSLGKSSSTPGIVRQGSLKKSESLPRQESLSQGGASLPPPRRQASLERSDGLSRPGGAASAGLSSSLRRSASTGSGGGGNNDASARPSSRGGGQENLSSTGELRRKGSAGKGTIGALLHGLSGRPPALTSDFSSLEELEKSDTGDKPASGSNRRRQSYFRTGGFVRPTKKFTLVEPTPKEVLLKTPIARRASNNKGGAAAGDMLGTSGGQQQLDWSTSAAGGVATEDAAAGDAAAADKSSEPVDTWDSVAAEPVCMICKMAFNTTTKLERHLKYSQMHARNADAIKEIANGIRCPEQSYYERNIKWEYRLIYSGSKFFWRTSQTIDVNFYLYEAQGAESLILILPYDPTADKELTPRYLSWAKVFKQMDDEDLLAQATECFNRQAMEVKLASSIETIHNDMRRRAVVTYLLIRLQQVVSEDPEEGGSMQVTVAKLATDDYDTLFVDKVPFLQKFTVNRQPRSSTGDIDDKIWEVQQETVRAQQSLNRAEGHLEDLHKTLEHIDALPTQESEAGAEQAMEVL